MNTDVRSLPPNEQVIKSGMEKVRKAFFDLVSTHYDYVNILKQSLELQDHTQFMRTHELKQNESLDGAEAKLVEMGIQEPEVVDPEEESGS